MIGSPFQEGDFVWCAFPQSETPLRPGPDHLAYVLVVTGATALVSSSSAPPSALLGYTTSQPWPHAAARPNGVFEFNQQQAAALGQTRAFVMDLRRLAFVPITSRWFPYLDRPDHGVQGHAPKDQQRRYRDTAMDLLLRSLQNVEQLGPLWPKPRR